jgi:5-methylcytosine-specific restriction endonuclease McrA
MKGDPKDNYLRRVPAGGVRTIRKGSHRYYIHSEAWKQKRRAVIKKHKGRCVACGNIGWHVHHLTYERLYKENTDDLTLFCGRCHTLFHESYGMARNMVKETNQFIEEMRRNRKNEAEENIIDNLFRAMFD